MRFAIATEHIHTYCAMCTSRCGVIATVDDGRLNGVNVDPDHPNAIGPSKRPMNTIIPALGVRDGRCELAFGVMGAHFQPMGHAHLITNLTDYRMDLQTAIDQPRVFYEADATIVERGISAAAIDGLKRRGHKVAVRERPWGGAQAIAIDWQRGLLIGASDGRKDGCAIGY